MTSDLAFAAAEEINGISNEIKISVVGESFLGKPLVALSVGSGKGVMIFGAHHALERITSSLIFLFARNIALHLSKGTRYRGTDLCEIFKRRRLILLPLVNPDGADIAQGLCDPSIFPFDRSRWQANARGVDLDHNYPFGFYEYKDIEDKIAPFPCESRHSGSHPLSESETSAVVRLIESESDISCILSLHTQGEEIYAGASPAGRVLAGAGILSRLSGYRLAKPSGSAAFGGLVDYTLSLGIPSYKVECGRGKNPLPQSDLQIIYSKTEQVLLGALTLF